MGRQPCAKISQSLLQVDLKKGPGHLGVFSQAKIRGTYREIKFKQMTCPACWVITLARYRQRLISTRQRLFRQSYPFS
jgi:hypothetical protein